MGPPALSPGPGGIQGSQVPALGSAGGTPVLEVWGQTAATNRHVFGPERLKRSGWGEGWAHTPPPALRLGSQGCQVSATKVLGQGAKLPQPRQASCTLVGHPPWPSCAAASQGQGWAPPSLMGRRTQRLRWSGGVVAGLRPGSNTAPCSCISKGNGAIIPAGFSPQALAWPAGRGLGGAQVAGETPVP